MSKRKKNYPDPNEVVKKYGADALRYVQYYYIIYEYVYLVVMHTDCTIL